MEKLFIVDASGYLYSSYFAIRNMTNRKGESTNALFGFVRSILKLIKDFHPTHLIAIFDGPRNAKKREAIYSDYKAHRSAVPQDLPYQINWAQEFCSFMGISYLNIPEVEADDAMGAVAQWAEKHGALVFLCTTDKDLYQMVSERVFLLNTRKDNQIIGATEVEQLFAVPPSKMQDLLAMIGDASDNIPGVPGIGPKSAALLLKEFGSLDEILANVEKISGGKKRALIKENADKALLSRQLVALDLSVDIPHTDKFYQLKQPDIPHLISFYTRMSFNSLIKELDASLSSNETTQKLADGDAVFHHYTLVDDEKTLHELIAFLKEQKEICFDTETTDIQPMKAELVGIGVGVKPFHSWYIPTNGKLGLEYVLNAMKPLFENPKIGFYGHHVKYDYHILLNYDIKIANICFDTILASYLLNSHSRQHSLDVLGLEYFGKIKTATSDLLGKGKNVISMRNVPIEKVCAYCCEDVDFTCRLKIALEKQLKERGLEKLLYEIEIPLIRVLAKMERQGIFLDLPCLQKMSHKIQGKIKEIEQEIYTLAGEIFNLNSPKQLSHVLQHKLHIVLPKKTATGFSTNADILEDLKDRYPIAKALLEYRTLEKLRTTYIENLPQEVNAKTHRIHCTFNQSVAATGRLSCQNPNLQNIPIRTEIGKQMREAFKPQKEGWSYLAADYSQIELRLLAHFSEDPTLIEAFQRNEDIHVSTAAAIFNIPLKQVTKEQRHLAKAINFGIIYGQQAYGLAKEAKIDVKTAAIFIEKYFSGYKNVKTYIEQCKNLARQSGKSMTFLGRERLIPEIMSKNAQLRTVAERLAINTPLQGTAADLIKLAMISIDKKLSNMNLKGYMILQIHDELIFEVPDHEIDIFKSLVKDSMQTVFTLKIPLIVDITLGKNWKEC